MTQVFVAAALSWVQYRAVRKKQSNLRSKACPRCENWLSERRFFESCGHETNLFTSKSCYISFASLAVKLQIFLP